MRIVRTAADADRLAVAEVHVRSWQIGYRGLITDDYLTSMQFGEMAAHYTFGQPGAAGRETVLAVERDPEIGPVGDRVLGFVTIGRSEDSSTSVTAFGEIQALYVDPELWRSGVGSSLMAEGRRRLFESGLTQAMLWVLVGNARAEDFYVADGWEADGAERTETIRNITVHERRMIRHLP